MRLSHPVFICIATAALAGCAGAAAPQLSPQIESASLAATEQDLDCGRITGRMQVRILSLRSERQRTQTTALSRNLQAVGSTLGLSEGAAASPSEHQSEELAKLKAYNARLAELGCKTYDLDKELAETDMRSTPRPR